MFGCQRRGTMPRLSEVDLFRAEQWASRLSHLGVVVELGGGLSCRTADGAEAKAFSRPVPVKELVLDLIADLREARGES